MDAGVLFLEEKIAMKLAEALIRRKALQDNIDQLRSRLVKVAKVQEGDAPAEPPQELLTALDTTLQELQTLIVQINRAISGPHFRTASRSWKRLPNGTS